jgi:hypothetical protein
LSSIQNKTLDKEAICRVSNKTLGKDSLPSVKKQTLGKETLCRVFEHSAKSFFAECFFSRFFCLTFDKELLCRVSKKHSVYHLTLDKEPNSGSLLNHLSFHKQNF